MEGESSATAMIAATGFTGQFNSVQNSIPLWGSPKPWFFHQRPHPTSGCTLKLEASVPPPGAPGSVHSISNKRLVRKTALIASDCLFLASVSPLPACFRNLKLILSGTWELHGTTWSRTTLGGMWVWPGMDPKYSNRRSWFIPDSTKISGPAVTWWMFQLPTIVPDAKHLLGLAEVN